MGALYLTELPEVFDAAGLDVVVIDGHERRSRSTGGYDPAVGAPVAMCLHHTAGGLLSGNLAAALHGALAHKSKPISNGHLGRDCTLYWQASGATNTEGQGGPLGPHLPGPGNYANPRVIGFEMDNNGVGEPWSDAMQEVILRMSIALYVHGVKHWGWEPSVPQYRLFAHFEWAPDRKIDPAGPSRWTRPGDRYQRWDMDRFRADVRAGVTLALLPPTPMEDDMLKVIKNKDAASGITCSTNGLIKTWLDNGHSSAAALRRAGQAVPEDVGQEEFASYGPIVGPVPAGHDAYGRQL